MAIDGRVTVKKIKDVFQFADNGMKGHLSRQDYKVAMVCLTGKKPYKWEVDQIFNATTDNKLSVDQFLQVAFEQCKLQDNYSYIRELFSAFDHQWKGYLTMDDLVMAQNKTFPRLRNSLVREAFCMADTNSDGYIGSAQKILNAHLGSIKKMRDMKEPIIWDTCENGTFLTCKSIGGYDDENNKLEPHVKTFQ